MKRSFLCVTLLLTCSALALAQKAETKTTANGRSENSASASKNIDFQSGTHLAAELQNTIDVRKANVGDRVVLTTTQALKSDGRTALKKGAHLFGHVTEVAAKTKSNGESRIAILFDTIQNGSIEIPITVMISSITSGRASARSEDNERLRSDANARSTSSAQGAATPGSGGLLGGVTNTAGGVVNATTSVAGNAVGGATSAVSSSVDTVGNVVGESTTGVSRSLNRIQISESSSTAAEGTSVLSLQGGNLRLEKGTTFNLVITQSANVDGGKQP